MHRKPVIWKSVLLKMISCLKAIQCIHKNSATSSKKRALLKACLQSVIYWYYILFSVCSIIYISLYCFRLNAPILGAMLHQACYHFSFSYVLEIMELCISEEVKPNKKFMNCLDDFRRKCKDISNDKVCSVWPLLKHIKFPIIFRMTNCHTQLISWMDINSLGEDIKAGWMKLQLMTLKMNTHGTNTE